MNRYKVLLFDADGTLFDFDKAESHALEQCLRLFGRSYVPDLHLRNYREVSDAIWSEFERGLISAGDLSVERFRRFFQRVSIDLEFESFAKQYLDLLSEAAFLYDGVEELLLELRGQYRMALLTNGLAEVQRKRLGLSPILCCFAGVIISEEVGVAKPDPRIFERALHRLNCADKSCVLMIGDSLSSDIRGGRDFGIDTCWYNPDGEPAPADCRPNYQISTLSELRNLLL